MLKYKITVNIHVLHVFLHACMSCMSVGERVCLLPFNLPQLQKDVGACLLHDCGAILIVFFNLWLPGAENVIMEYSNHKYCFG